MLESPPSVLMSGQGEAQEVSVELGTGHVALSQLLAWIVREPAAIPTGGAIAPRVERACAGLAHVLERTTETVVTPIPI